MNTDKQIQIMNFLKIINAALTNEIKELCAPDWKVLYSYAIQQSILPLFYEGCSRYSDFASAPENLRSRLFTDSVKIIADQVQRTDAFLEVYDKLLSAGIKPLVLKGLICRSTYGELADCRPSGDEDIYIKKEEYVICRSILASNGFVMKDLDITDKFLMNVQAIDFINPASGLKIEVHINPFGKENKYRRKMNSFFEDPFKNAICCEVSEQRIYTLCHTDHFLFLLFHFYKHFIASGVGLRQLMDILMYEKSYHSEIDWTEVNICLKEMSADRLYGDIAELGRLYLGFPVASEVKGFHSDYLLEDIMEAGIFGKKSKDVYLSRHMTAAAIEKGNVNIFRVIFPKAGALIGGYPILNEKPYLLPYIWMLRCIKFIRENGLERKLITDSIETGKRRTRLLKKYNII